ncbi:glutamate 5-kinase, putative [Leishmania tarentolae]|uniref:Glutamate 5-kinase, putative n=1 Tax=Leishmania tarentolae TaxID=5689 RepID=A0A640KJA0_LEITA|nr:glutamate 5-kinase, putative [Leishmania tarentolae]
MELRYVSSLLSFLHGVCATVKNASSRRSSWVKQCAYLVRATKKELARLFKEEPTREIHLPSSFQEELSSLQLCDDTSRRKTVVWSGLSDKFLRAQLMYDAAYGSTCGRARIVGVVSVDVAENHKEVSFEVVGNECGQTVIVAEDQFVKRRGIVFIDDGDHLFLEKHLDGIVCVDSTFSGVEVVGSKQHLRAQDAVPFELSVVHVHQEGLTHGRECLPIGHRGLVHLLLCVAGSNCTGGDKDDFILALKVGYKLA